jgi:Probable RNA and SrmB- binding site of polymerase A/Poly A polymerase head domain
MSWREELTRRFPALAQLGGDCYVVGGAIRDLLLGIEPGDADVACVDALSAARSLGGRLVRLGDQEQLTAWRVVLPEHEYDFAALLGGELLTDLARRDFTSNAMAVDLVRDVLIDPHGGQRDVAARLVRMIRPSNFDDDPLRMLKGVRMAVKYGFIIEPETLQAIRARAPRIAEVARERVAYELTEIFGARAFRRAVALLHETRLDAPLGLRTREFFADDVSLAGAWALLVDDPQREAATLRRLIDEHDRVALYDAGEEIARQLPAVLRALGRDDALDWPDFETRALLGGEEIAALTGLPPGKELGRVKRELLEAQIMGKVRSRDEAEMWARASARAGTG